jgi:S-disulfanyl-L-cysteine oxidoreductase SoxD
MADHINRPRRSIPEMVSMCVLAFVCFLCASILALAQGTRARSVWSGVYTDEQAARGKAAYEGSCTGCHGPTLGGVDGPALAGSDFLRNWLEDDLNSLFRKVQDRMPGDAPGSLPENVSLDIVAFLLQANEFPSGAEELTPVGAALSAIRIESKDGPAPVPNFSLVRVVGCLTQDEKAQWIVTHGTEPVRARDGSPSGMASAVLATALGSQTFRLMDAAASRPEDHKGEKVEVKGLLMRQADATVLNVTSLQSGGSACPE